jgi:hypothetical protein
MIGTTHWLGVGAVVLDGAGARNRAMHELRARSTALTNEVQALIPSTKTALRWSRSLNVQRTALRS